MTESHVHHQTDELSVFVIPADVEMPMKMTVIQNHWEPMTQLVEGYIELVRTELMPVLECGCRMVMVVNEEGIIRQLPTNVRAMGYYPHARIAGDVFLVGEGPVTHPDEPFAEPDLVSLPQSLSRWAGPGSPLPSQKQPWEHV